MRYKHRGKIMSKKNETILIIGGSSGMGLATAKMAVDNGFKVIIASRSQDKLNSALKSINHENLSAESVDTFDENNIAMLFKKIGDVDHLVITASEVEFGNIHNSPVANAKRSFDSKFFGPFRVIQAALEKINSSGSITLFSGTAGTKAVKNYEILAAINAAVDAFARTLAMSLAPIRVNSIAPGLIDTPAVAGADAATKKLIKQFSDNLIIKRIGQADEVAQAVLFLVTNKYVTGTTLYVDGGHVIS